MVNVSAGKLGLLVTTYNSMRSCESFSSWLEEVHFFFETVVIVDDCSSDGSYEYLVRRLGIIDKLRLVRLSDNSGRPSIPRNVGMKELVDVDRLVFLDIDDLLSTSYLKFLSSKHVVASPNIYSGVKVPFCSGAFNIDYQSDFSRSRRVSSWQLRHKNELVLSGASVPIDIAFKHQFDNCPLEDWLFWRKITEDRSFAGRFIRLLDVPIGYDVSPSLSPLKYKQLSRVYRHLSGVRMLFYFAGTIRLKAEEFAIRVRIKLNRLVASVS